MTNLNVFSFQNQDVRFADGKPVANDVAKVLGYKDPANAVHRKVFPENKGLCDLQTPGGIQSVAVLEEAGIYQLIFSSKLETAKLFQQWVFNEVLPSIRKTGSYSVKSEPVSQFVEPEVITAELEAIKFFTGNGDLQLAQLAKCHLGNRYLASQQKLLKPVDVPQYEGVVDVAIRLGFNVPSNYESALGTYVAKQLKHLAIGQDKRYSTASSKQVGANMYQSNDSEVEKLVLDYCVSKAFYRREMNWIN